METLKSFLYFGKEEAVWGLDIMWVKVNKYFTDTFFLRMGSIL